MWILIRQRHEKPADLDLCTNSVFLRRINPSLAGKGLKMYQQRSQDTEKVMHIKGRLLDQAMILFNCLPFQMKTSLKGKNLLPEGANSFLYEQFLIAYKITFITLIDLP